MASPASAGLLVWSRFLTAVSIFSRYGSFVFVFTSDLFDRASINNARGAGPCQGVKRAVTETLLGAERKSDVSAWEPPRQQTTYNKGADLISTFGVHSLGSLIDKRRISVS